MKTNVAKAFQGHSSHPVQEVRFPFGNHTVTRLSFKTTSMTPMDEMEVGVDFLYLSLMEAGTIPKESYLEECYEFLLHMQSISPINLVLLGFQASRRPASIISIEAGAFVQRITRLFPTTPLLLESECLTAVDLNANKALMNNKGFLTYPLLEDDHEDITSEDGITGEAMDGEEDPVSSIPQAEQVGEDQAQTSYTEASICLPPTSLKKQQSTVSELKCKLLTMTSEVPPVETWVAFRSEIAFPEEGMICYSTGVKTINDPVVSDMSLLRRFLFHDFQHHILATRVIPMQIFNEAKREFIASKHRINNDIHYKAMGKKIKEISTMSFGCFGIAIALLSIIGFIAKLL